MRESCGVFYHRNCDEQIKRSRLPVVQNPNYAKFLRLEKKWRENYGKSWPVDRVFNVEAKFIGASVKVRTGVDSRGREVFEERPSEVTYGPKQPKRRM